MSHPLDNCVYSALTSDQTEHAVANDLAARYRPEVSPLAGLAEPTAGALRALADLTSPREVVVVLAPPAPLDPFEELGRIELSQWVCDKLTNVPPPGDFLELGAADAEAMYNLAKATDPGPFEMETYRLGDYIGIRDGDVLAAMAGERMCMPGYREVSAVCTAEGYGRRGYAQRLVAEISRRQIESGATPFLHVRAGSPAEAAASRVYEKLGYSVRWRAPIVALRRRA